MPRKSEIQGEEAMVSSPLRRSSRRTSVNSPAPASVTTRRTSQTQNENTPKTRQASLSQDNSDKDKKVENKPATRGRRASVTKEESDPKPEPAKTRSRRSSASSEPAAEEEPKQQATTRRRRSSATEDPVDPETVKPVRTRRGSATEKPTEEEPAKRTTRARRGSVKDEEPKEEPVKKTTRSRRNSVDKAEETEPKEKKTSARGRRSSTSELEEEPESKTIKLTPIKSKRRPSVTEKTANLEPIEEAESEIKGRSSSSPPLKEAFINLVPIKPAKPTEVKGNLNLSTINETSFIEETQDDTDKGGEKVATPRRSPRLNKLKSTSATSSPNTHKISNMEENQSHEQDKKDPTKEKEGTKELLETKEEHLQPSPRKLDFLDEEELASDVEKDGEGKTSSNSTEAAVLEEQLKTNEEITKASEEKLLEKDHAVKTSTEVETLNISVGSDGSFNFHLNVSIPASQNDSVQEKEDLNSSKSSNTSDKENVDANTLPSPSVKKTAAEGKEEVLNSLIDTPDDDKSLVQQEIVVARVSNVFRPTMKENSFIEPMEVDEYSSILDSEQEEPREPHAKENLKDIGTLKKPVNKNVCKESLVDVANDSVEESFYLYLSNSQEEKQDESKGLLEITKDVEDLKTETPEKLDENSKSEKSKEIVGDSKDDGAKVETLTKESEVKKQIMESPIKNVEIIVLEQESCSKGETILKDQTTAAQSESRLEKTLDESISFEKTVISQETKKNYLTTSLNPSDKNDAEPHSPQQTKEKEAKTPESNKSSENIERRDKQKRMSKSPTFISLEIEDYSNNEKTSRRKSKSPQPQQSASLRRSKSPLLRKDTRKSKSPQPSLRISKSPQPAQDVTQKNNSPQPSLRRSKSPQLTKEKMEKRKSKSPQCLGLPKGSIVQEKISRKSKSPQPTKLNTEKQTIQKATESISPPTLPEEKIPTESSDNSLLNTEKAINDITSPNQSIETALQEEVTIKKSGSPVISNDKQIDEASTSPKSLFVHFEQESILLRKLKSPLLHTKRTDEKIVPSEIPVRQLGEETKIETQFYEKPIKDADMKEEKMVADMSNSPVTAVQEENPQKKQRSISLQSKSFFSVAESPSTQNIKITDIETEVRRRSKSPELRRRSKSPQSSKQTRESTERVKSESEMIKNIEKTEEEKNNLNIEPSNDLSEKSESCVSKCEEIKSSESQNGQTAEETNPPPKELEKSAALDDYDFEVPSDEEEAEKTHPPEYDQSTVVASFMTSSKFVDDGSISTEMETVILINKEKTSNPEPSEKENFPTKETSDGSQNNMEESTVGLEIHETYIEINDTVEEKSLEEKEIGENDEEEEIVENADVLEESNIDKILDSDEVSENIKKAEDDFVDEVQNHERKDQKNLDSLQKSENYSDKESDELADEPERYSKGKINTSDMKSPQKKLKVRKYSLKKKMDSYEKDMEKDNEEKKSSDDEESEREYISKVRKRSKKRSRVTENIEYAEEDIEKDNISSDNDLETKEISPKKKSKSKRKSDANIESVRKSKKFKEYVMEESDSIEEIKTNDETTTKTNKEKLISPSKSRKSSTSSEEFEIEENKEFQDSSELPETPISEEANERKSKKRNKKAAKTSKEKQTQEVKDSTKKSPSSMLDEFITRKIAEMSTDESDNEDESPEEPNEYVCTMAEEGEEDTPSEDSNAIIDEGESIGSTESEYGSDNDEYDENDSFICDDEEEQLLSGEEYDLSNEKTKKKKKKSRIIQLDNSDDEIIKTQKKEKTTSVEKKRTRIITLSDSSESEENENETELNKDSNPEENVKVSKETNENEEIVCIEEKTDEEVFIVETKPSRGSLEESPDVSTTQTPIFQQHSEKKRLSSITIHENIDVKEIKDSPLSERISNLVDSFCTTMRKGEISMNLSIECTTKCDDESEDESENNRSTKKRKLSRSSSAGELAQSVDEDNVNSEQEDMEEEVSYKPPKRMSVSMDSGALTETKKKGRKRRKLSKSMDNLNQIETKTKKKKTNKKKKKVQKDHKKRILTEDDLRLRSLGLINQLITDIKNRPRRTVRPSTNMNNSWHTEVVHVKPSTTAFDKEEKAAYKAGKVHPKDFRSQMLNDPSRVRRVDTKTLLKKKGVYL